LIVGTLPGRRLYVIDVSKSLHVTYKTDEFRQDTGNAALEVSARR